MIIKQQFLTLNPRSRGFHLITEDLLTAIGAELSEIQAGFLQVFIQHTSASVTLNENADPDVRLDMETAMNNVCPETTNFQHTCEGPDDMPAHVKSSLIGNQLMIPVADGHLALGTWQGIYLCEHRDRAGKRRLVLTAFGV